MPHPIITISIDQRKLNLDWVFNQLKASYWGGHYNKANLGQAIARSTCFGAYINGGVTQVGFARVVSDGFIFSSIMDVIVQEDFRCQGIGTLMIGKIIDTPEVRDTICVLDTKLDAFYMRFGFVRRRQVMQRDPS